MTSNKMNIRDFCDDNNIKWFPINLQVEKSKLDEWGNQKYTKVAKYPQQYKSKPNQNDFINLDEMDIIERHDYYDDCDSMAVDTTNIWQIDVDFKDNWDYKNDYPLSYKFVKELIKKYPYKESSTKKKGKHFFIKIKNSTEELNKLNFPKCRISDINCKYIDIEVLKGQWSFTNKNISINNYNGEIPEFDINDIYGSKLEELKEKHEPKINEQPAKGPKRIIKIKSKKGKSQKSENNSYVPKGKIEEIANIIDIKYLDDYDSWTKIIWSLSNDTNDNYNIAKYISMKSTKYDETNFNNLWENSKIGNSISTMFYYAKLSNEKLFYEIITKYTSDNNFTHTGLAQEYLNISDDCIYKNDTLYIYYNNKWYEDAKLNKLRSLITKILLPYIAKINIAISNEIHKLVADDNDNADKIAGLTKKQKATNDVMKNIQQATFKKYVAECIIQELTLNNYDEIEFDKNGYILPFKNVVYDLKKHVVRKPEKSDYILSYINYDLDERNEDKLALIDELINKIFPNKNIRDNYLGYLATGLYGVHIEKFVIANGSGRNGKGVVNELMEGLLTSTFFYRANNTLLLNPLKEGINIQVANMNNKRMVVYTEPDSENKKINSSTMKELTGGKHISAEKKFSNDDQTRLKAIHILECNKRPKINGKIDTSITGRISDIPFVSYFTTNKDDLNDDNANNVYEANSYYKSDEFKDEYKTTLFYYLIDFIKKYKIKNDYDVIDKLIDCTEVKERTKVYLDFSDEKYDWFINTYKKKDKSYVSMKDVFFYFKHSDYYNNLTKKDKRDLNYNSFTQYIKDNHNLRRFFRDTYQYKDENGCKKCVRSILLGFVYNPNDIEGEIDEGSESDYLE